MLAYNPSTKEIEDQKFRVTRLDYLRNCLQNKTGWGKSRCISAIVSHSDLYQARNNFESVYKDIILGFLPSGIRELKYRHTVGAGPGPIVSCLGLKVGLQSGGNSSTGAASRSLGGSWS